jgi:hypothetical protein
MTPARAVEVAALFEDSVIAVKHLTLKRAPNARVTQALLAGGALSLMGALGTFIASVHQVAVMRRAHDAAVAAHREFGPFVLPGGGRWLDFVVALCLVAGTWALFLGAARWLAGRHSQDFFVGPSPRADVTAPLDGDVPLVQRSDDGWVVNVSAPMRGELSQGDALPAPLSVPSRIAIADGTRAFVDVGALRFVVGATDLPPRMATPLRIDWAQEAYIGAVGMAAGLFLGLLYLIPPDPKTLAFDPIRSDLVAHYIIKAPEPEVLPTPKTKGADRGANGGRASAGPRGAAGNPRLPKTERGGMKIPGKSPDPRMGKGRADEEVRNSAPMQVLAQFEQHDVGSVFSHESALGPDAEAVMGRLFSTIPGGGSGEGGMDLFGRGKGGGGDGTNTIGVDLHGIGKWGPNNGGNHYVPGGGLKLRPHTPSNVEILKDPIVNKGEGWSKDLIKRVIHAHHNEIKFCYDKRLSVKPSLASGRVVARFLIAATGHVLSAGIEASTLNDRDVEGCIAEAIRRWDFPKPEIATTASVSYPFVLQAPQ